MTESRTVAITRRAAVGTLAAGGLTMALWPMRDRAIPKGRVVIDYWEKWTGHEGAAMRTIVDEFNASQDRIWVRYLSISGIGTKAMVAIAGGDPPDVIGLWSFSIVSYSESKAIYPLDEFAPTREAIHEDKYAPAVWRLLTRKGRLWAGVNTASSIALYYNRAMFRDAGLDPDAPPKTIAEMDEAVDRLTVLDDTGEIQQAGFLHKEPGWWAHLWPLLFGGTFYDPEHDRATAASEENIRAYEWVQSYPERYGVGPIGRFSSGFGNYNSPQMAFLTGKVAMVPQGPWLVNNIMMFRPELEFGATAFPVDESIYDPARPRGILECDTLVIPRGCKHPEEAAVFVAYTQRMEVQERLARAHAKGSPMRQTSEGFQVDHPNPYTSVHDYLTQSDAISVNPPTVVWPQYNDEIRAALDNIWLLEGEPTELLTGVEQRMQQALDTARARRIQRHGEG